MSTIYNAKNVLHMFVGKNLAPATGTISSYADLTDGQLAILNEDNTCLTSSTFTNYPKFRIAVRNGTSLLYSPWITRANITNSKTTATVADTQQITYIGYNGSTGGSFTPLNSNDYITRITFKTGNSMYAGHSVIKDAPFASSAAATQDEVATGILQSLYLNFLREAMPLIQFDMVNSAAVTAGNAFDGAVTVVNGLSTFTVTSSGTYATGTALAVNDYVRLGTVGGGTALTNPVYKVLSISGSTTKTVTVNVPITLTSGTYAHATADAEVIPNVSLADYGIKMTGLAETNYQIGTISHELVQFNVNLINFATSDIITYSTAPVVGKGLYPQIADMFAFAQGNWGKENRLGIPIPTPITPAVSGTTYNMMWFSYYNNEANYLSGAPRSYGEVLIAMAYNVTNNNLVADIFQQDTTHFVNSAGNFYDFS